MSATKVLPQGFDDLERFADWALPTELDRMKQRCAADLAGIRDFYDVMLNRVDAALDHLDRFDLDAMPEAERRLFYLTLSLVEIGNSVEIYNRPNSRYALPAGRFTPLKPEQSRLAPKP